MEAFDMIPQHNDEGRHNSERLRAVNYTLLMKNVKL